MEKNLAKKKHFSPFFRCDFVAFRVDLRLRSPIIMIFRSRSCEQTTEQSRTLEYNRNSRREKSGHNGEKSGMHGEKSGENGEKYCMDTLKLLDTPLSRTQHCHSAAQAGPLPGQRNASYCHADLSDQPRNAGAAFTGSTRVPRRGRQCGCQAALRLSLPGRYSGYQPFASINLSA
jgi:hypothetical protein